jgi:hypothetical protein
MDEKIINKKGQVAIFVIVAVIVVASIMLFFFLRRAPVGVGEAAFDPEQYIQQCVRPSINDAIDIILPQGGFLNPLSFKIYNDTKIAYICKTDGYYVQCVTIHPMLINEINAEIKLYISPVVESCFASMKTELEKRQATIEFEDTKNISVSMAPGKVFATVVKNIKITEKETTRTFEKFDVEITSPIYNLASIAVNIAEHERNYCYFEYVGYMAEDISVDIRKFMMSDATKIYTIKDRASGKIMNIAIRSCAMPAGI